MENGTVRLLKLRLRLSGFLLLLFMAHFFWKRLGGW